MVPLYILMTVEGLGINLLGCYGGAISKTPNVDEFASHSVVFDQCWLQSLEIEKTLQAILYGQTYALEPDAQVDLKSSEEIVGDPINLSLAELIADLDLETCFVTDAVELAESSLLDHFDDVALVDFDQDDTANDRLDQTRMAKLMQFAITKLYEDDKQSQGIGLLWIHSKGLHGSWDAPYELRTIPCDEEDPEPSASTHPPRKQLDEETDPDVLFDAICGASAQAAVFDFAWSYLNELLTEQETTGSLDSSLPQQTQAQPIVMLMGVSGYPLGEHEAIGDIDRNLYAERLHVPLMIQPGYLSLGRRLPQLTQPWQVSHWLAECFPLIEQSSEGSFWCQPPTSSLDWESNHLLAWAATDNEYSIITPAWTARVCVAETIKENPNRADLSIDAITPMASWQVYVNPDDRFQQNDIADRVESVVKKLSEIATTLRDAIYGTEGKIGMQELQKVLESQLNNELIRLVH